MATYLATRRAKCAQAMAFRDFSKLHTNFSVGVPHLDRFRPVQLIILRLNSPQEIGRAAIKPLENSDLCHSTELETSPPPTH